MKRIAIVAPAKHIEKPLVDFARQYLAENGFDVVLGSHVTGSYNYFSGTDAERKADFQLALNDEKVDVILCARGGYGSVRIIDDLNFDLFLKKPKLIVGFSDITVFHNHINRNYGLPTVHGTVPLNFQTNSIDALQSLLNVMNGVETRYEFEAHALNIAGEIQAPIVGGNLSIIHNLIGSKSDLDTTGKILFIEDIGEAIYSIDRMMYALKRSGKFENLKALVVGGMTSIKDSEIPFGKSVEELIHEIIKPYHIPLCFNFPAGHIEDNRAIILGKEAQLKIGSEKVVFSQAPLT